jgi:hypothetical protein
MFQKAVEDVHGIAERTGDNDGMEPSELVRGEIIKRHTPLGLEVFGIGTSIDGADRDDEAQPISRGGFAPTPEGAFCAIFAVDCGLSRPRKRCRPALVPWLSMVFRVASRDVRALATRVLLLCLVSHLVF